MENNSYTWGIKNKATILADGLINIKKELMHPNTGEVWHFHKETHQWFLPLNGELSIETQLGKIELSMEEQIVSVPPLMAHKVWNNSSKPVEFYLISSKPVKNDKFMLEYIFPSLEELDFSFQQYMVKNFPPTGYHQLSNLFINNESHLKKFLSSNQTIKNDQHQDLIRVLDENSIAISGIFKGDTLRGCIFLKRITNHSNACELTFFMDNLLQEHETSSIIIRYISELILNFGFRSFQLQVSESNNEFKINLENAGIEQLAMSGNDFVFKTTAKSFLQSNAAIKILNHRPDLSIHFKHLNEEWIGEFFEIEEADKKVLDFPQEKIIAPGGEIFYVSLNDEIISTGAIMPSANGDFELTKMATTKKYQGLGFGDIIIKEVIKWCRNRGVASIVLYTQSTLFKALNLYKKHGFTKEELNHTHYKRADVKMRLKL